MKSEIIPRNLNEPDLFDIGLGLKIKFSDLPLLIGNGIMGNKASCLITKIVKIENISTNKLIIYIGIGVGVFIGFILSKIKIEDQSLMEIISNIFIFNSRKIMYRGDKGD